MRTIVRLTIIMVPFAAMLPARSVQAQTDSARTNRADSISTLGLGFQFSSSGLFLISWQSPEQNSRSCRIEPMVGFTYSASNISSASVTTAALTIGLGYYLRWRMPIPFTGLFFSVGPRVLVTGYKSATEQIYHQDSAVTVTRQYMITSLALVAGPEYAIDEAEHFTVSGLVSLSASIQGHAKYDPPGGSSAWSFNLLTGTGIVLRYYFK